LYLPPDSFNFILPEKYDCKIAIIILGKYKAQVECADLVHNNSPVGNAVFSAFLTGLFVF